MDALRRAVVDVFRRLVEASAEMPDEMATAAENLSDPRHVAYFVAAVVPIDVAARQELLELDPVSAKLRRLIDLLQRELAVRELGRKITTETEERLTKKQREYYLREQLRSIQQGAGGRAGARQRRWPSSAAASRRRACPTRRGARRSASSPRLAGLSPASPEHGMIVTYLEWMASLPWNKLGGGAIDIRRARQILDEDHFDLEKVKDRILEYLAVKKLRQDRRSGRSPPIRASTSCPPAAARHRRQSGAGADPVLRGAAGRGQDQPRPEHRPGARPAVRRACRWEGCATRRRSAAIGEPISARCRAASSRGCGAPRRRDPVFMLDEIDKIGSDWRGDPSSALLEVLDPAQNHTFADNYLGVPFDLSQVLFIATANTLDTIPGPLRDRMEILTLSGYTDEEKVGIARAVPDPEAARRPRPRPPEELSFDARGASARSCGDTRARRACGAWSGRSPRWPGRWRAGWPRGSASPS